MHDHPSTGIREGGSRRLLLLSLSITSLVFVVQVIGGVVSGSLALVADAAHMLTDAVGLLIALLAQTIAARPADDRRTYGYRRAEVFGALTNAVVLIVLCLVIGVEGVRRLIEPAPSEVEGGWMFAVAIVGLAANAVAMWLLSSAQRRDLNVRGAYLEVMGDLIGSVLVIAAAIVIVLTGWLRADAIASILIAVLMIPRAVGLLREVVGVLSESAPEGTSVADIRRHLLSTPGVSAVHDVHVWQLTRGAPVFTAHVIVEPQRLAGDGGGALLADLQECLSDHFDVEHSTFQLEPEGHQEEARRHC